MAATLRLPPDVEQRLVQYCSSVGAAKNRVVVLALRSYLDDGGAPALPVGRDFDPQPVRARDGDER